ncbi:hypothetical protein OB919_02495 [Halobacteria archaeon AArc-curdl1]|uniref:Uncharacterized protein n=1 Tax=Natronosalvus hydrolyticus TaxID=2979988 RepID=A0AAP2Z5L8_9EURY|nr:hypothetical protein [Halobacteria archaeon AArc-curdl1]
MAGSNDVNEPLSMPQWRPAALADVALVIGLVLLGSVAVGALWSYARIGQFSWLFVREAQFIGAAIGFIMWVIRNRSGGQIDEVADETSLLIPPVSIRLRLNPLTRNEDDVYGDDAHLFLTSLALALASVGVEIALIWSGY